MKKSFATVFYIVLVLLICVLPFACMGIFPSEVTTENRIMATFPSFTRGKKPNTDFFTEFDAYFEDRFAFRQLLVTANAKLQATLFGSSSNDTVIKGTDGWLYYAATLPDYQKTNTFTKRQTFNIANNLSIIQETLESKGKTFLFTVAPNKNTLYAEHMPYYYRSVTDEPKNIDLLSPYLKKYGINYCDLFSLLRQQDKVLYYKGDSHWNNEGAVLVYDALLNQLGVEHDSYDSCPILRTKTYVGDLSKMLFAAAPEQEWESVYQFSPLYKLKSLNHSVEDAEIETVNKNGQGNLLMFRDSFANTLVPLFANTYKKAAFMKAVPYPIETLLQLHDPDTVIIEKVERNIKDFLQEPALLCAPKKKIACRKTVSSDTSLTAVPCDYNAGLVEVFGTVPHEQIKGNEKIFLQINGQGYEAFTVSTDESDTGFRAYFPLAEWQNQNTKISVIVKNGANAVCVFTKTIPWNEVTGN